MIDRRPAMTGPWASRPLGLSSFWQGQALLLMLLLLFGTISRTFIYNDLAAGLTMTAVLEPSAVAVTAVMREVYRRLDDAAVMRRGTVALVAQVSLLGAILLVMIAGITRIVFDLPMTHTQPVQWVVLPFFYYFFIFLGWSMLYFWISASISARESRARATAAENAALRAELEQLRLQLDPHFLFNALNGVAVEIPERPEIALGMLHDIADYLRSSLQLPHRTICRVQDEETTLRAYLAIQEARFGERLSCQLQIDGAARERPIPGFVLQLLVENAIKHGLRSSGDRLDVLVRVEALADGLRILVRNTGRLVEGGSSTGVGLHNLQRRLAIDYPGRHSFKLVQDGNAVRADLHLEGAPCHG